MLALAAIGLGLLLGLSARGSVSNLRHVRLPRETLFLVLFAVQALARGPLARPLGSFAIVLWGVCSLVLLVLLLTVRSMPGLGVAATGIALNMLVILLNGAMPVVPAPSLSSAATAGAIVDSSGFYALADGRTLLPLLGDVLPAGLGLASLGDVLLAVGVALFFAQAMAQEHD